MVSIVGSQSVNVTNGTSNTLYYPSGIQNGDVAFLVISNRAAQNVNSSSLTSTYAFTQVGSTDSTTSQSDTSLFTRTGIGPADSGTSIGVSFSASTYASISLVVVRGIKTSSVTKVRTTSSTTTPAWPAVTPTFNDNYSLVLTASYAFTNDTNIDPPAGWNTITESWTFGYTTLVSSKQYTGGANEAIASETGSANNTVSSNTMYRIVIEPDSIGQTVDLDTPNITVAAKDLTFVGSPNAVVDLDTATVAVAANDVTLTTGAGIETNVESAYLSIAANDVTVEATQNLTPSRDETAQINNGSLQNGDRVLVNNGYWSTMDFDLPSDLNPGGLNSANLRIVTSASIAGNIRVRKITSEWTSGAWNGNVLSLSTEYVDFAAPAAGVATADITSLLTDSTNFYGLFFTGQGFDGGFASRENATVANRPRLALDYDVVGLSTIADAPTASAISVAANDVTVETINPVNVDVTLDSATVAVQANDVNVAINSDDFVDTATGISVAANDVTVETSTSPNVEVFLDSAYVSVDAVDASVSINAIVDMSVPDTISVEAHDATAETIQSVIVDLDTPNIQIRHVPLDSVNGEPVEVTEEEDLYFVSTMRTFNGVGRGFTGGLSGQGNNVTIDPSLQWWFRFNERSGNVAVDRTYSYNQGGSIIANNLSLSNVTVGQRNGPDGRHNFYFNGDAYAAQPSGFGTDEIWYSPSSLEFTFRTERKTQFLMGGSDQRYALQTNNAPPWELWLEDGRLVLRQYNWDSTLNNTQTVRGAATDLADGKWHHIVLQNSAENSSAQDYSTGINRYFAFEVYVDSKLELRRRVGAVAQGFPDFIGGRPDRYYTGAGSSIEAPELAKTHWFLGDMTEVIFRNGRVLTSDEIATQRDNVMGIRPVYLDTPNIKINAVDATARGNKPRVLVLHFSPTRALAERGARFSANNQARIAMTDENYVGLNGDYRLSELARFGGFRQDFQGFGERAGVFGAADGGGLYQLFHETVFGRNGTADGQIIRNSDRYRDPITDNYRLVDLEKDINMEDYDIISIVGYPRNEYDWADYNIMDEANAQPVLPARRMLEDLMVQVKKQAIQNRKGLFINDPFSAIALGIINKVDYVPNMMEMAFYDRRLGAQTGIFDWRSAQLDPFNGANPEVPYAERPDMSRENAGINRQSKLNVASRYEDTNANIKQRVKTLVKGLTDQPGWVHSGEIRWWNLNPLGNPPYQYSRHFDDRTGGLRLGDEFFMEGAYWDGDRIWMEAQNNLEREAGWVASPVSAVKVGSVVTTFGNLYYNSEVPTGNAYSDYAVSIAVQPGDIWDGQNVTGKVYVNFTEAYTGWPDRRDSEYIMQLATRFPNERPSNVLNIGDVIKYSDGASWSIAPEHLYYQFSTHFGTMTGSEVQLPDTGGSGGDWGWSPGGKRGQSGGLAGGGAYVTQYRWRSMVPLEEIPAPTMAQRALKWLATDLDVGGNAFVNVETATNITVKANDVEVETQTNTVVDLTTARTSIYANDLADSEKKNVIVPIATAEIRIDAVAPVTEVVLETATINVVANDMELGEFVVDWDDAIVLTLPRQLLTLTLEDN